MSTAQPIPNSANQSQQAFVITTGQAPNEIRTQQQRHHKSLRGLAVSVLRKKNTA